METTPIRKLPVGIQDFTSLREDGYLYVDKTALVYKMVTTGKPYFLSRPRRFGKSLLLSTFEAYFLGRKDLFKGLAIEQLEKECVSGASSESQCKILRNEREFGTNTGRSFYSMGKTIR